MPTLQVVSNVGAEANIFLFFHGMQTDSGAYPGPSCLICRYVFFPLVGGGEKVTWPGRRTDFLSHLVLKLRMSEAILPFLRSSSWNGI
jgi:hypothetical protein